jgi:hypothetical protein
MASRYPALFKVRGDGCLIDKDSPAVPETREQPLLDEAVDVLLAAAEYIRALLNREQTRSH